MQSMSLLKRINDAFALVLTLVQAGLQAQRARGIARGNVSRVARRARAVRRTMQRRHHAVGRRAAHGDFGTSYYGIKEPVRDILARELPMTMRLAACAITLAAFVGILLGTIAAVWQSRIPDRSVLTFSTLGVTLPNFVLGPLLVYIFCVQLNRLPTTWEVQRYAPDYMYLILPVVLLAMRPAALLTRLTRASMIDTMQQEFIRMAVAKGVPRTGVIFKHGLRNAILPVITSIGTSFGFLLTGSFVVERIFIIPGIGQEKIGRASCRERV